MYSVNDLIVYGSSGVCRVASIEAPSDIPGADGKRLYYTLRPLFDNGVIRIPVDTRVFMRPVISRGEAEQLISEIPALETDSNFTSTSPQLLSEHYRTFFTSHECGDLLTLIKTVYAKSQHSASRGKSLGRTDQHYYQRARELLEQEFSVALNIPVPQVSEYIAQKVQSATA